jgi:hypothetical protein
MAWAEQPEDQKQVVFQVLEREAMRLEREAVHMEQAAKQLGRPSLVERHELGANAFRDALAMLRGQ